MVMSSRAPRLIAVIALVQAVVAPGAAWAYEPPAGISSICVEAGTGTVVSASHADLERPPASMVKMMLMLLVAEGVAAELWTLDKPIQVSAEAQRMGGAQLWLKQGDVHALGRLMNAVAVASANDAAFAVAEGLWGSEAAYLRRANQRAAELGMKHTTIRSVHGLPPSSGEQHDMTTARDMATLALACTQQPLIMGWVKQKEFRFEPGGCLRSNTNKLLGRCEGCDGLKTGWIRASGWCLTATAVRDGVRVIAVVMGCPTKWGRFNTAETLIDQGFEGVTKCRVVNKGEDLGQPVSVAKTDPLRLHLKASQDLWVTVRTTDLPKLEIKAFAPDPLPTYVRPGDLLGEVRVLLAGKTLAQAPLSVPTDLHGARWRLDVADYFCY